MRPAIHHCRGWGESLPAGWRGLFHPHAGRLASQPHSVRSWRCALMVLLNRTKRPNRAFQQSAGGHGSEMMSRQTQERQYPPLVYQSRHRCLCCRSGWWRHMHGKPPAWAMWGKTSQKVDE